MMNLLQETLKVMAQNSLFVDGIIFMGSEKSGHCCTWEEYAKLADKDYDNGYGGQVIASDLIIVFSNGTRMVRSEYDGSECWSVIIPFKMPTEKKSIKSLFGGGFWRSLKEINDV